MAEAPDALNISYDAYNDVLRVLVEPGPVDAIAVPGGDVTVLVSPGGDRTLGIVFERYMPVIRRGIDEKAMAEGLPAPDDESVLRMSLSLVQNIVPAMLAGCAPQAKDTVARWVEFVSGLTQRAHLDKLDQSD